MMSSSAVVRKHTAGGTLKGAYAPALLEEGASPPSGDADKPKPSKEYMIKAPSDAKPGQVLDVNIDGQRVSVTVPEGFDRLKAARFRYTHVSADVNKIIASTLPTVPGYDIVWAKPIVYGCQTLIIEDKGFAGKATVASTIAKLSQDVQDQVNSLAIEKGCNAVLGCQFSVATDRLEKAVTCRVAVTCYGTPCVIVPSTSSKTTTKTTTVVPVVPEEGEEEEEDDDDSTKEITPLTKLLLYDQGIPNVDSMTDDRSVYSVLSVMTAEATTTTTPAAENNDHHNNNSHSTTTTTATTSSSKKPAINTSTPPSLLGPTTREDLSC